MIDERDEAIAVYLVLEEIHLQIQFMYMHLVVLHITAQRHYQKFILKERSSYRKQTRLERLNRLISVRTSIALNNLGWIDTHFVYYVDFFRTTGGLKEKGEVGIEEQVAIFLNILGHHEKNHRIKFEFQRSGETISRHFNAVLRAVLRLQGILLSAPDPVTNNCTDEKWKCFKNCLGALDGTYIRMRVPEEDQPRYHTRKGDIATNVLGVCSWDMKFIYVLPGWEGSAADSRVLKDAISRRNGFMIPMGYYYLVDAGYTNGQGFLALYRGTRYHLSLWRDGPPPTTYQEIFNLKHSSARNVVERCFGLLKIRWAILRSPSFYPVKTQGRIITACCLLHNLIWTEMAVDPMEAELDMVTEEQTDLDGDAITIVETSDQWTEWRDNLANEMKCLMNGEAKHEIVT